MVAVTIKGKQLADLDNEKELSLMCKLLPENKARREFSTSVLLFEREVFVYNEVLSMFEKFQLERCISLSDGFFKYPKSYLAVADATKNHYVIVMENVKVSSYELWDKMKPINFATSSIFLAALGRFHGLSFALRDQKPELFKKLLDSGSVVAVMLERLNFINMMTASFDKAKEHLVREDEINLLNTVKGAIKR